MKGIDELHTKYADRGLVAASIIVQNKAAEAATPADGVIWQTGLQLSLPVWVDTTGAFFSTYDPKSILPMAYIIDREGTVKWVKAGSSPEKVKEMETVIEGLL